MPWNSAQLRVSGNYRSRMLVDFGKAGLIDKAKAQGRLSLIYLESPANPTNALVVLVALVRP